MSEPHRQFTDVTVELTKMSVQADEASNNLQPLAQDDASKPATRPSPR